MSERGVTNLLLIVIAAVLLFGRDVVLSNIKWLLIIGAVVFALVLIWLFVSAILGAIRDAYLELMELPPIQRLLSAAGIVFLSVLVCFWAYAGYLWIVGEPNVAEAAMASRAGDALTIVMLALVGLIALAGVYHAVIWLRDHFTELPDFGRAILRAISVASLAPVLFPLREWNHRTRQKANSGVRLFSTIYVGLVATLLWSFAILLSASLSVALYNSVF